MNTSPKNIFLIIVGFFSLALGVIGIILPLLPTTPFVLLAAMCFAKSSPKFHHWITHHHFFGPIIESFQPGNAMPKGVKTKVIIFIWITLSISIYFIDHNWVRAALFIFGAIATIVLLRLPSEENKNS